MGVMLMWLLTFGLVLGGAIWEAFVATILWRWFIVPLGAPALHLAHAYGLLVFVALVRYRGPKKAKNAEESSEDRAFETGKHACLSAIGIAFFLGVGAVTHWLM